MSDHLMQTAYLRNLDLIQLDEADRDAAKSTIDAVFKIAGQHLTDSIAVKSDPELNDTGKHSRLKGLVERADQRIHAVSKHPLAALQDRALKLQSNIDNQSTAKLTPEMTALHIEARGHLHAMDPLERDVLLQQLAESGEDDRTLDAALNASAAKPLVKSAKAAVLKATKAARQFPDIAGELDSVNQTHGALRNAISSAKHEVATVQQRNFLGVAQIQHDQVSRADAPGA